MKFLALLSGGKDSCYNIMKCQDHGHELVCLANLSPPNSFSGEELNSFMYQSAAHSVIPAMSKCFGVPLIRHEIKGAAVNQALDYVPSENDEVEDLYELIKRVKELYPDILGVSCGAIVSNYQRFRVENVCNRLGLTPLTYLWQRDRASLLNEMLDAGIHAVLVKVAGAGLDPLKHLGRSLSELHPTLTRLNERFGLDVCGEGGEYESLVLDCRAFRRRLVVDSTEVVLDSEDPSVGNLKIIACHCEDKQQRSEDVATAAVENNLFNQMDACCKSLAKSDSLGELHNANNTMSTVKSTTKNYVTLPLITVGTKGYGQSELIRPHRKTLSTIITGGNDNNVHIDVNSSVIQSQLHDILSRLSLALQRVGAELADIVFVHLYISSISMFAAVNAEYCKWFGKYPPSRSCVAVPLPHGEFVTMDAIFVTKSHHAMCLNHLHKRNVLHVQSMSEWAPLCIGPYSQANSIYDSLIFVAGQIPLDPTAMTLLSYKNKNSDNNKNDNVRQLLHAQITLACRHVHRVLEVQSSSLKNTLCCTVLLNQSILNGRDGVGEEDDVKTRDIKQLVSQLIHTNCNNESQQSKSRKSANGDDSYSDSDIDSDSDSDEGDGCDKSKDATRSLVPIAIVYVSDLPRNALVEVEVVGLKQHYDGAFSTDNSAMKYVEIVSTADEEDDSVSLGASKQQQQQQQQQKVSVEKVVMSWPLWNATTAAISNNKSTNADSISATAIVSATPTYKAILSCKRLQRNLCFGFCEMHTSNENSSSAEEDLLYVDTDAVVQRLLECLNKAFTSAEINPARCLQTLRVYYPVDLFEDGNLRTAFARLFVSLLKITVPFPVLLIPVDRLSSESCVLAAQFQMIDFIQIESELWINKQR